MKKLLFLLFIICSTALYAQNESLILPGRIIFYNVENLFDTINDPDTKDEEFLPSSGYHWDTEKYQTKLKHISHVLATLLDTIQPIIIGLAEVENKKVIEDLLAQPELKKFKFGIAHHDSPDKRGIDVALLYNKDILEDVFEAFLTVDVGEEQTREIMYIKGFMTEETPFWIFVNHWPSRRAETDTSGVQRSKAAEVLKRKIEDVYLGEPSSVVIVMGDFNDNPTDSSISKLMSTNAKYRGRLKLVNLMAPLYKKNEYTLRYKNNKDVFDQFIVSENITGMKGLLYVRGNSAHIYSPGWLLFKHPQYGYIPNRTYSNGKYTGGYSDHLPIYFDVIYNPPK